MLTRLIEARTVVSLACAAALGTLALAAWPFPEADPVLGLIATERPTLNQGLAYAYATVWFSTPFLLLHTVASVVYVYGPQARRVETAGALPPYRRRRRARRSSWVRRDQHCHTVPGPAGIPGGSLYRRRGCSAP